MLWVGRMCSVLLNRWNSMLSGGLPPPPSRPSLCWIASRFHTAGAGADNGNAHRSFYIARALSASQRSRKVLIGLTGTTLPVAPGTSDVLGVDPVLIENGSNGTGGRLSHRTLFPLRSRPVTAE